VHIGGRQGEDALTEAGREKRGQSQVHFQTGQQARQLGQPSPGGG
jgi:hypothetical protein